MSDVGVYNRLSGTVTSVALRKEAPSLVVEGAVLYTVDDRSVVVVSGDIPVFRTIEDGTKGADVEQLQLFLERVGAASGSIDGAWGPSDAAAWRRWLRTQALAESSTVTLGQVMFVPNLPRRIAPVDVLAVGRVLAGSEQVASLLGATPLLFVDSPRESATLLRSGTEIAIEVGAEKVLTRVSARRTTTETGVRIELEAPPAGCGKWCEDIGAGSPSVFRGLATISPPVTGTIVPIGALRTGTGDGAAVVLADGTTRSVLVLARVGAEAVVSGVEPNERLQLPGPPTSTSDTTAKT